MISGPRWTRQSKRNFEIFKAPDFIAAALLHLPPKGQQTVRYYGLYSNKSRGQISPIPDRIIRFPKPPPEKTTPAQILLIPAPPKCRARDMRPLWRDLILKVWGGDPSQSPSASTKARVGDQKKSRSVTAGPWSSMSPEALKRPQKAAVSAVSENLGTAAREAKLSPNGFPPEIV